MHNNKHYLAVSEFYGAQRAQRSQVPLIAHIHEGLLVMEEIGSTIQAKEAFCVHPLLQADADLLDSLKPRSIFQKWSLEPLSVAIAMEYRHVANAYLSHHYLDEDDQIHLSPLKEVNDMLIADKVQNRKDFEIHHSGSHPNAEVLGKYFLNWLRALGVSETRYGELVTILSRQGDANAPNAAHPTV